MTFYILDTDHVSLFQSGHPLVTNKVNTIDLELITTTVITLEEQLYGRLNRIRRANSSTALVYAYEKLEDTWNFFDSINLLSFTNEASFYYDELIKEKIRIGTQDLKIASIALSVQGVLVTRNYKDFMKVPNLQMEDWSLQSS
ncbi:type II toxin-antitoxin system VapC family toxin [Geminocystis sp. CENA526]|uniref:type II toxin-antitoxin system VapC family toxin n=1 Tax=Geminocystis sp. CENA526 TaxID=1355871 RepID=UPI003D6EBA16